jgi:hypothetical protein
MHGPLNVKLSFHISRQLFKDLNILTLASLYMLEVICFIRKCHQFVELNSNIHTYNT